MDCCLDKSIRVLTAIVACAGLVQAATATTHIAFRERVVLSASVVRLGDVAEVVSADRGLGSTLSALPLTPSPPPGTERFLNASDVENLLAAHGYDVRTFRFEGAAEIALCAPATSYETRHTTTSKSSTVATPVNRHAAILARQINPAPNAKVDAATADRLRAELYRTVADYLRTRIGAEGWTIDLQPTDQDLALLAAARTPITCQGGRAPWNGRQLFIVLFSTAEGPTQVPLYANITADATPLAVATRPIARGEVITAADVQLQVVESPPVAGRRITIDSMDDLIGMEARHAIQAGDIVYADQVQAPLLVKRGEVVAVVAQAGGIRVRTEARARQDGALGDLVQVESIQSRQQFDARVTGLREAAVYTSVRPPARTTTAQRSDTALRSIQ